RRITGLRSKTTKARTYVERLRAANADLKKKLAEALEQQAATSEVLGVISRSPGELARVFQGMLENAIRICGAKFGILFRYEGGVFHPAAMANVPPAFADFLDRQGSFAPVRGRLFGPLAQTKKVIRVVDRATEPTPIPSVRYGGAPAHWGVRSPPCNRAYRSPRGTNRKRAPVDRGLPAAGLPWSKAAPGTRRPAVPEIWPFDAPKSPARSGSSAQPLRDPGGCSRGEARLWPDAVRPRRSALRYGP